MTFSLLIGVLCITIRQAHKLSVSLSGASKGCLLGPLKMIALAGVVDGCKETSGGGGGGVVVVIIVQLAIY